MLPASPHLCRVDCPLSKVPPDLVAKHEGLVLAALDALQPVARLRDVVARWAAQCLTCSSEGMTGDRQSRNSSCEGLSSYCTLS